MTIALRGSASNTADNSNALTIDLTAASVQENDYLVHALVGEAAVDFIDESGWTRYGIGHNDVTGAIFTRLAPSSYTSTEFNLDAATYTAGIGAAFSGVDTTTPLQVLTTHDEQTSTTSPDNKPVTAFQTGAWAIAILMADDGDMPADPKPTGYTLVAIKENEAGADISIAMSYKILSGTPPFTESVPVWTLDLAEEFSTTVMIISQSPFTLGSGGPAYHLRNF